MSDHGQGGGERKYNMPPKKMWQKKQPIMWHHQERTTSSSSPVNNGDDNSQRNGDNPTNLDRFLECTTPVVQRNGDNPTNLDRFLECTTPVVRIRHFPQTTSRRQVQDQTIEIEHPPHFVLKDLWDCFQEWSAMAIEIPLLLDETHSVTQYYVPYLSAIQLYIDPSKPNSQKRPNWETSSDGSNNAVQGAQSHTEIADESDTRNPFGQLVFEYFEHENPYDRRPLFSMISTLAESRFPDLMVYRSCDLSPYSWVSVAWYPVYMIPQVSNSIKVDTCFLTYHCLSTQGTDTDGLPFQGFNVAEISSKLPLCTFGLAFYKFKAPIWITAQVIESPKVNSLLQEAENWIKRLGVVHPDFMFFESRKIQYQ